MFWLKATFTPIKQSAERLALAYLPKFAFKSDSFVCNLPAHARTTTAPQFFKLLFIILPRILFLEFLSSFSASRIRSLVRFALSAKDVPMSKRRKICRDFCGFDRLGIGVALEPFHEQKNQKLIADSVLQPIKFFEVNKENVFPLRPTA